MKKGILFVNDYVSPKYYECATFHEETDELLTSEYVTDESHADRFDSCFTGKGNETELLTLDFTCPNGCTCYTLDYFFVDGDTMFINSKKLKTKKSDTTFINSKKIKTTHISYASFIHNNLFLSCGHTCMSKKNKNKVIEKMKTCDKFIDDDHKYEIISNIDCEILQSDPTIKNKCADCNEKLLIMV